MHSQAKIDIRIRPKYDIMQFQFLEAFSFSVITLFVHLFLINNTDHFQDNSKIFATLPPCMVINSRQKRYATQTIFARAKLFQLKKSQILFGLFDFKKSQVR